MPFWQCRSGFENAALGTVWRIGKSSLLPVSAFPVDLMARSRTRTSPEDWPLPTSLAMSHAA